MSSMLMCLLYCSNLFVTSTTLHISLFCDGLYSELPSYDFVGNMGRNFYSDLRKMGKLYGITDELQNVFHFENQTTNHGVETSASLYVLEYYSPRTVKRVLEYLSMDYLMLNLPIPKWALQMLDQEDMSDDIRRNDYVFG